MKNRPVMLIALGLVVGVCCSCVSQEVHRDTVEKLVQFIKGMATNTLERDYRSQGMAIHALVSDVRIDPIARRETEQDHVYLVRGRITYRIAGNRVWKDKEGNIIQLGPEQDITHWFICGVLEDKYMHTLFQDDRSRLAFYADEPKEEVLK